MRSWWGVGAAAFDGAAWSNKNIGCATAANVSPLHWSATGWSSSQILAPSSARQTKLYGLGGRRRSAVATTPISVGLAADAASWAQKLSRASEASDVSAVASLPLISSDQAAELSRGEKGVG